MTKTVTFTVCDLPPVKSSATSLWTEQFDRVASLRRAVLEALKSSPYVIFKEKKPVKVEAMFYINKNTRLSDLDNMLGGVLDGLQTCPSGVTLENVVPTERLKNIHSNESLIFEDDWQVFEIIGRKEYIEGELYYTVTISPLIPDCSR